MFGRHVVRCLKWCPTITALFIALVSFSETVIVGTVMFPEFTEWLDTTARSYEQTGWRVNLANSVAEVGRIIDEPYGVPKLVGVVGWWTRLGLKRFDKYSGGPSSIVVPGVLTRQTVCGEEDTPWHHWVFLSDYASNETNKTSLPWEEAFDNLVQYHHVHPPANNAEFHYASCPRSNLCKLWQVKAPALVHFMARRRSSDPLVEMRVFEFPLPPTIALKLLKGNFPSPFNQLRSLTMSNYAWRRRKVHNLGRVTERLHAKALIRAVESYPQSFRILHLISSGLKPLLQSSWLSPGRWIYNFSQKCALKVVTYIGQALPYWDSNPMFTTSQSAAVDIEKAVDDGSGIISARFDKAAETLRDSGEARLIEGAGAAIDRMLEAIDQARREI